MICSRRCKVISLVLLLMGMSLVIGFFLGIGLSSAVQKKKDDPVFMKDAVMKKLETLKPTDAQRTRFKSIADDGIKELVIVRDDTKKEVIDILTRMVGQVNQELTQEQREEFAKMKPKAGDVLHELFRKMRDPKPAGESVRPSEGAK